MANFNETLEKVAQKTLWIWLPFAACGRLLREFREKYLR
jgi:hypothetical protein